jgi:hypothetical protein
MDQPVDEHTEIDLRSIAGSRQLTAAQHKMLIRNVTGALRPNRDFFLWVLVNVLSAVLLCARRRKDGNPKTFNPVDCALEIVWAQNSARRALLAHYCDGQDGVALTGEGIAVALGGLKFEASWARIGHALAFGEFFLAGNDCALYGSFEEAIKALSEAQDASGVEVAVSILSRRIGQWRRDHLPFGRYERQFSPLIAFLESRRQEERRKGLTFDDDDIVAYWRKCVDAGERPMLRTVVERFRDFERHLTRRSIIRNLSAPAELDALVARVDLDLDPSEGWNDTEDDFAESRLVEALESLPAEPKALKGTERDLLVGLIMLLPFPKQRPVTVLRVLAFGAVQSGITNRLRRGGGGADIEERVTCSDAQTYDDIAGEFGELLKHLESLLRIAGALRFGDPASMQGIDPALAEMVQQRAEVIQQGNADLKRMRRAGFDLPREDLAAIFAEIDGVLGKLHDVVHGFTKEIKRRGEREALSDRFARDKPVFIEILTRAYNRPTGDCVGC